MKRICILRCTQFILRFFRWYSWWLVFSLACSMCTQFGPFRKMVDTGRRLHHHHHHYHHHHHHHHRISLLRSALIERRWLNVMDPAKYIAACANKDNWIETRKREKQLCCVWCIIWIIRITGKTIGIVKSSESQVMVLVYLTIYFIEFLLKGQYYKNNAHDWSVYRYDIIVY